MAAAPQWPKQETSQEEMGTATEAANGTGNISFDAESATHRDDEGDVQRQVTDHKTASTEQEDDEDERYYWDREPEENTSVTTQTQLWHQAHWMGTKAVEGMEIIGEVCANIFGFNNSEFQDIYNSYQRQQEWEDQQKQAERERLRILREKEIEKFRQQRKSGAEENT